jgi:hypothetical protein
MVIGDLDHARCFLGQCLGRLQQFGDLGGVIMSDSHPSTADTDRRFTRHSLTFEDGGILHPHGARDQVLVDRDRRLLGRDQAGVELLLQQRMVLGELHQLAVRRRQRESPMWPSIRRAS